MVLPTQQAPGWYPDRDSVLATALSDTHSDMLSQMLTHDEKASKAWLVRPTLCLGLTFISIQIFYCLCQYYHHSIFYLFDQNQQQMVKVMDKLDEVFSKRNYAKSIRMATEAIETNEGFVRSLYGASIACE